jgi:hypothetical protein
VQKVRGGKDEDMGTHTRKGRDWKLTFIPVAFATPKVFTPKKPWPWLALRKEEKEVRHSKVVVKNDGGTCVTCGGGLRHQEGVNTLDGSA